MKTKVPSRLAAATLLFGMGFLIAVPGQSPAAPQKSGTTTPIERGRYLVSIMGCNDCHTPLKFGARGPEPDMERALSGHPADLKVPPPKLDAGPWLAVTTMTGWAGPWGISYAANITPDTLTGIGNWSEDIFTKTMRTGRHWGVARPILPPMPWQALNALTDEDLKAVYVYLRSIRPVRNQVPDAVIAPPPAAPGR